MVNRRQFIAAVAPALAAASYNGSCSELLTPYKLGKLVVTGSGHAGDFDQFAADCPFVFHHGDQFFMTYVGFDGVGYQTGLAASRDLIAWTKQGCILSRDPSSPITKYNIAMNWILRENDLHSQGRLSQVRGEFVGVYHAYPNSGYESGAAVIGICRSKDLNHWRIEPPCLTPEQGAAWELGGLYKPCLVKHEEMFYLFYNAKDHTAKNWNEQTGVAMSHDLKHWARYEGNPVIPNGAEGRPDSWFASDPCVLRDDQKWALYYFGRDKTGARELVATSPDLLHFTKCDQILIDIGPVGSIDSSYAHKPSLVAYKGDLYHFYCAVSNKDGKEVRGISVARSRTWA